MQHALVGARRRPLAGRQLRLGAHGGLDDRRRVHVRPLDVRRAGTRGQPYRVAARQPDAERALHDRAGGVRLVPHDGAFRVRRRVYVGQQQQRPVGRRAQERPAATAATAVALEHHVHLGRRRALGRHQGRRRSVHVGQQPLRRAGPRRWTRLDLRAVAGAGAVLSAARRGRVAGVVRRAHYGRRDGRGRRVHVGHAAGAASTRPSARAAACTATARALALCDGRHVWRCRLWRPRAARARRST